jgi:hypothetical protein
MGFHSDHTSTSSRFLLPDVPMLSLQWNLAALPGSAPWDQVLSLCITGPASGTCLLLCSDTCLHAERTHITHKLLENSSAVPRRYNFSLCHLEAMSLLSLSTQGMEVPESILSLCPLAQRIILLLH